MVLAIPMRDMSNHMSDSKYLPTIPLFQGTLTYKSHEKSPRIFWLNPDPTKSPVG